MNLPNVGSYVVGSILICDRTTDKRCPAENDVPSVIGSVGFASGFENDAGVVGTPWTTSKSHIISITQDMPHMIHEIPGAAERFGAHT